MGDLVGEDEPGLAWGEGDGFGRGLLPVGVAFGGVVQAEHELVVAGSPGFGDAEAGQQGGGAGRRPRGFGQEGGGVGFEIRSDGPASGGAVRVDIGEDAQNAGAVGWG